ncbi:TPA: hypothetical protein ACN3X6_001652 [Vibrio cholerae]|nr:hypothetical protein [Vibrio cholerae]
MTNRSLKILFSLMMRERPNSVVKLVETTDRSVEELSISIEKLTSKAFIRIDRCGNADRLTAFISLLRSLLAKSWKPNLALSPKLMELNQK